MRENHESVGDPAVTDRIIRSVKIPSLPEAVMNLLEVCRDDQVGSSDIVRVVELDSALSARLLKVANSSYFGQQSRVSTLTRAAVVLGNEHLKAAALGFYLAAGWKGVGHDGFNPHEFWRDNLIRACLGRLVARAMELHPAEQAFLVNMLGDIGTLILVTHFGDQYLTVLKECPPDYDLRCEQERRVFQTDHLRIAEALAKHWNFPELLVKAMAMRYTEPPFGRTTDPTILLWQISYFCAAVPFSADRQTAKLKASLRSLAISAFGFSFEALSAIFTVTVQQYNVLRDVFSDLAPADCNTEQLIEEAGKLIGTLDPQVTERVSTL